MRLKSINDRMDTCPECGLTALFMYLDATGLPLCPKCSASEIQAFKDSLEGLDDDLELFTDDDLTCHDLDGNFNIDELDFN